VGRYAMAETLRVVPFEERHREDVREVCLSQASERARTDALHGRFTLLMYCDAYLDAGIAYVVEDERGRARGYILCAEDAASWRQAFAPYLARIDELGPVYARRAREELDFYESVAEDFPAHLHIDVAEECTGRGCGRMLVEALLERLGQDGVAGVVFGVAAANERAVGFYDHMGFERLSVYDDGGGLTFCKRMAARAR